MYLPYAMALKVQKIDVAETEKEEHDCGMKDSRSVTWRVFLKIGYDIVPKEKGHNYKCYQIGSNEYKNTILQRIQ